MNLFNRVSLWLFAQFIKSKLEDHNRRIRTLRVKMKYFEPTITETVLGTRVTWKMRDRPLTDEELDELIK